ncbi:uncharacterized protein Dwil_GK22803 [Drosophila willistoni]|uniref:Major facilitator superfamily (MFS) profile domain-containing protein n=1 Tax=Drosophila willistoni TaxID=7260 RepID=B4NGD2_DROWI|nr:uncharacterized protein Dwil_GK22803 [Drosophila willistoni]
MSEQSYISDTPKGRRLSPIPDIMAQISHISTNTDPEGSESPVISRRDNTQPEEDIIAHILGDFGVWQLRSILIIFLCKIPAAWFMALIIFTAPEIYPGEEFNCDTNSYGAADNCTVSVDQCYVVVAYGNSSYAMRQCQKFHYAQKFRSLIMEFDLVCLCDIFVAWSQYWHLFGMFIGGVVATRLLRVLSPRRVYATGIWALLGCGLITGLVNDFSLHCAFRCLSAVSCSFMITAGQAIFTDITAGKHRQGALLMYDTFWALALIFLPGIASFAHSWRHIYLGITLPSIAIVVLLPWTPDSPRWLLKHTKNSRDTVDLILQAARINDRLFKVPKDLPLQLELLREKLLDQPPPARWLELWRGKKRVKLYMIVTHMALATFLISHMGLLLNIRSFGRDYLAPNTMGIGFAELLGCFLALHLTFHHNTRKWQWAGGFCILGGLVGCLCWFFSDVEMPEVYEIILWMFFAALPKAAVSCAQSMILACMGELVPPEQNAPFAFSVVTWARVWLLSASFLTMLKQLHIALSLTAFCVLVILGGLCTCCLVTPKKEEPKIVRQTSQLLR